MPDGTTKTQGETPEPTCERIRRVMRGNRSRDTGPEIRVRQALWAAGLRGYRLHRRAVPGTPDMAYVGRKVAVFVHGCFWHCCPRCRKKLPAHHTEFWKAKLARVRAHDRRVGQALRREGWTQVVLWECEVKRDLEGCVGRVAEALGRATEPGRQCAGARRGRARGTE